MRRALRLLDSSRNPHKQYKYGYQPDPRKLAPMRTIHQKELFPTVIRPPTAALPDHTAFLQAWDIDRQTPLSEHAALFEDWQDMQTMKVSTMVDKGMSRKHANKLRKYRNAFNIAGVWPDWQDRKETQNYYKQFHKGDKPANAQVYDPVLPEKYRPHQLGEEQRALPNHAALNRHPEWSKLEEARLQQDKR